MTAKPVVSAVGHRSDVDDAALAKGRRQMLFCPLECRRVRVVGFLFDQLAHVHRFLYNVRSASLECGDGSVAWHHEGHIPCHWPCTSRTHNSVNQLSFIFTVDIQVGKQVRFLVSESCHAPLDSVVRNVFGRATTLVTNMVNQFLD